MKLFARKDLSCEEHVVNYRRCFDCAFGILTAKWRLLNKAIETNVNKAERIARCICLLHDVIIDLEGTTHDHSFLQETSQIRGSRQAGTNISGRSFSRSSKGAIDVRNAFKAYFNPLNTELNPICQLLALLGAHHILHVSRVKVKGPTAPMVSQNQ